MPQQIKNDIEKISNPVFARYARQYQDIYDDFTKQVSAFGLPFGQDQEQEIEDLRREILALSGERGVTERNDGASLVEGEISPACRACSTGVDSYTGFISLMCHRNCFFCFNENQENFETYACQKKDWLRELEQLHSQNPELKYLALTGGEPLLHKKEMLEYFRTARRYWPGVHMRLYTSGDLLDQQMLENLREVGLNEIRFSLKLDDEPERREKVFCNMELALAYIPCVMVEMPVLPDTEETMQALLDRLEKIGIFGINLLEFCFPFANSAEFQARGYELRYPPYRTLYNFWYAGGLPVAGSELAALKLLRYSVQKGYRLNVHYCSLENKHFGQIYMQNSASPLTDRTYHWSQRDFYLKTIKAFGRDADRAEEIFRSQGCVDFYRSGNRDVLQFHPSLVKLLEDTDMELGISYNVKEWRDGQECIRELRIDYTTASRFDGVL
jgi:pyruvate formate-lyase activating enzyme-like uncharacterized protein